MIGKDKFAAAVRHSEDEDKRASFLDGVKWFKENLWHNPNELPKENTIILFECDFDDNSEYYFYDTARIIDTTDYSEEFVRRYRVRRWCYINDIIDRK